MTLGELRAQLRAFAAEREGWTAQRLATAFVPQCAPEAIAALLVEEFKWVERAGVRMSEIAALSATAIGTRNLASTRAALADLASLLDEPYRIGDGTVRRFGALTIEEHRVRLLMLEANIAGLQRDVEIHRSAIALCEEHQVSCLDDLERQKVAA